MGQIPYQKELGVKVDTKLMKWLYEGNRLPKPKYCNNDLYVLMRDCWKIDKKDRPTFGEILKRICEIELQILPAKVTRNEN